MKTERESAGTREGTRMPDKTRCPNCRIPLSLNIHLDQFRGTYQITAAPVLGLDQILAAELLFYWRWKAEGERPFVGRFSVWSGQQPEQYYYDGYHAGISYDQKSDLYSFSIQLSDSPDGDSWAHGTFRYDGHNGIVDVKSETSRS